MKIPHITKKAWHKVKEFFEFSMVGIASFFLMLFVTLVMTELLGVSYKISYGCGLATAYTYQFVLNMRLTFTATDRPLLRLERFVVIAALMLLLNWITVVVVVELMEANYLISIIMINIIMGLLSFELQDVWVFKKLPKSTHHRIEEHIVHKVRTQKVILPGHSGHLR